MRRSKMLVRRTLSVNHWAKKQSRDEVVFDGVKASRL